MHSCQVYVSPTRFLTAGVPLLPCTRQGEMLPSMDATNKTSMSRVRYASLFVEERYTQ